MTMRCECTGCGEDCSHAYATHNGYPYHFGCLPEKPKRKSLDELLSALPVVGFINVDNPRDPRNKVTLR